MDNIFIKKDLTTPTVELNSQKGLISFEGKSRPEDPDSFYIHIFIKYLGTLIFGKY